ncbi:MAG: hypothetical protein ACT4PU_06205 [Planctomycetota bacterium]
MTTSAHTASLPRGATPTLMQKLNREWHEKANYVFLFIVLAHWAEHLAQTFQIYVMGWAPPDARGVLGLWYPWLVKSELMHYGYALVMLAFLWMLRDGFKGRARTWWTIALVIQFWHHIEHFVLQAQPILGANLFGKPVPFSFVQLIVPRVELHLIYNTIVFVPMVVAMYYHLFPSQAEQAQHSCDCAVKLPGNRSA